MMKWRTSHISLLSYVISYYSSNSNVVLTCELLINMGEEVDDYNELKAPIVTVIYKNNYKYTSDFSFTTIAISMKTI